MGVRAVRRPTTDRRSRDGSFIPSSIRGHQVFSLCAGFGRHYPVQVNLYCRHALKAGIHSLETRLRCRAVNLPPVVLAPCELPNARRVNLFSLRFSNECDTVLFHGTGNGTGIIGNCFVREINPFFFLS